MPRPINVIWLLICSTFLLGCDPPAVTIEKVIPPPAVDVVATETVEAPVSEIAPAKPQPDFTPSPALAAFLPLFDELSAKGFVPTLRRGSTGIGYTLETMLDIPENNSPKGDFMGMELKAWRDDGTASELREKMNLFLKEPKWVDGLKSADRVRQYGYVDDNGREALYSTVTNEVNSHGLVLAIEEDVSKLWMSFKGQRIAFWDYSVLSKRLNEKHTETVFVSAEVRGAGKSEEFHYAGVNWCREPSVESFLSLLQEGEVFLELRMHVKETGSTRNHGSCFRIHQNRLKDLFKYSDQVRPSQRATKEP